MRIDLQLGRHRIINGLAQQQKADHVRPQYRYGRHLEQLAIHLHYITRGALARKRLLQRREPAEGLAHALIGGGGCDELSSFIGHPHELYAEALTVTQSRRGESLRVVTCGVEVSREHSLEGEIARQQG